MKSGDLGEFVN